MNIPAHDRRTFLKYAAAGAAGFGLQGQVWPAADPGLREVRDNASREGTEILQKVIVRVEAPDDPLAFTAFDILKDRMELRCPVKVVRGAEDARIVLALDPGLHPEAFRLDPSTGCARVSGGSPQGLLYGVGKLLRTSGYGDGYQPSSLEGVFAPQGILRGMYFATHFHNWHQQASDAEVFRYLEDLALWGINAVMVAFPMINLQGWDDPQMEAALAMMKRYARAAHTLGLQFTTGLGNTMFIGTPDSVRATPLPDPTGRRGNSGHPVCPSLAEGHAYIMDNTRRLFENLADVGLDIVCFWPYDEGGCACAKCAPWGCNGYLRLSRDLTLLGREYFPKMKTVLSTWMFDTPPEGEWQGLTDALAKDPGWVDYILADSHEDFPRYPLDHSVPGGLPLLNFPEISMWGNSPWGGFGANPLPSRFQRLLDQVKGIVTGGFPYSEGIYEDMNKAVVAQFYWDRDQSAADTLREYIAYEFGPGVEEEVLEIIGLLESAAGNAYRKEPVDPENARRACAIAEAVEARLPNWGKMNWRWELLRLRTVLDRERFGGDGLESPAAEAALLRLMELYHCQMETDDPYHHRVRPPLKRALSRKGTF